MAGCNPELVCKHCSNKVNAAGMTDATGRLCPLECECIYDAAPLWGVEEAVKGI